MRAAARQGAMSGAILLALAAAVAAYALFAGLIFVGQSRQVYFPERELHTSPAAWGMPYEDVFLRTEDGVRLHGWFVPARAPARATLLFLHGNAGNISHRLDSIRLFRALGLSVLIIDYRGYGRSEGRPDEVGTYRDAEAAWRHLRFERGVPAQEIVIFGRSLGAAVAARLAAGEQPGAVILESAFTSAPELGAELLPWLPVRLLLRFDYDTRAAVREIRSPLLLAHSPADEIVPFRHGRALFEAAREPKRFLEMRGGHNDGFLRSEPEYSAAIDAFLAQHLRRAQPRAGD